MSRLALYLLGPPRIERDGVPIKLGRRKAIALLAYIAVTEQSQRRAALVNLLWPEYDSSRGRSALRRTLYALNKALAAAWLEVDREEIGLNPSADLWVDVEQFRRHLAECETHGHPGSQACPACLAPLTDAVALVRGDFMSGFSLKDSFNFDDWQLFQAEALRHELIDALERLVRWHSARREFKPALGYARRRLALDPLNEAAHRQLMRLYIWSGQRSAALSQYEECVAVLKDQLGVSPQQATSELYRAIKTGHAPLLPVDERPQPADESHAARLPPYLEGEAPQVETPPFVARERELAQLDRFMDLALADQGRVVFVIGQAGSGKTALVEAFTRHAQEEHANLIAASGKCNAYTGIGDPYLPWREILGLLTGDVQARWAAGAMTRDHARRLWDTLPLAAQALVETGPDLIGTFIPRAALLQQVAAAMQRVGRADWLARLQGLGEDQAMEPATSGLQQSDLFEQYTRVLHALARQVPLVLVVDDLQWADLGSISLLFHLGRQLAGSRILIVGTYRSEEVTVGKDGARHPLEALVHEFQRDWGDVTLNLDQAGRRGFVEALLDNEPNRLGRSFRDMLHRQTGGHALFTIELLRGLQEQGALVKDSEGRWVEGSVLNWQTLPARVEAVIAQRIGRLPEPLQAALRVASVEGEVFTTEVVARVRAADEGELVARFSRELDRRHQLVHAHGFQRIDSRRLSHYRFRHILFQKYLYSNLDEVERAYLHEAVGTALEALYEAQMEETAAIAPQLARHFEEAGLPHRAIPYLCLAGKRAVQLSAYEEGIAHLTKGLALLTALPAPDSEDQRLQYARQELALQLALGMAWVGRRAYGPHGERAYNRARELSQQLGETSQLCLVLGRLAIFHYVRTEHRKALELAEEALSLAERTQDPLHVALGHRYLGSILLCLGEFTAARAHFAHMISFYEPEQHHRALVSLRGSDAGTSALAYDACCLWCLGYPEQALNRSQQALAVARALGHPFSLADVLSYAGGYLGELRRDGQALMGYAEELKSLAQETPPWSMAGTYFQGEALLLLGRAQEGLVQIREGMDMYESMGVRYFLPGRMLFLAEAQAKVGQPEQGLDTLDQALAVVEETGERYWESELHRLRAELLLIQGDEVDAEASFHKAIEVARRQSARSWELRATTSLARLWQARGKIGKAREMLAATYDWFTEGFDTPDLREAKALLEELS